MLHVKRIFIFGLVVIAYTPDNVSAESHSIIPIPIHSCRLDCNGNFDQASLRQFLTVACAKGISSCEEFKRVRDIEVEDIFLRLKGSSTSQLFRVKSLKSNCEYVFKEMLYGYDYVYNMSRAYDIDALQPFLNRFYAKDYPSIVLPTAFFSYVFQGKDRVCILLPRASGLTLEQLTKLYADQPCSGELLQRIAYAYTVTGRASALFHAYFRHDEGEKFYTMLHSDFSFGNIVVDESCGRVSYIDNEGLTITYSQRGDAVTDLLRFLMGPCSLSEFNNLPKEHKESLAYLTTFNFLKAYLSALQNHELGIRVLNHLILFLSTKRGQQFSLEDRRIMYRARFNSSAYQEYKAVLCRVIQEVRSQLLVEQG